MPLDLVARSFSHGGTAAITRFNVDMPTPEGNICLIRQVQFIQVDFQRMALYDITYGLSLDPDHAPASLIAADSRMPVVGRISRHTITSVGFQTQENNPRIFMFPEGLKCPYTRLPFFMQHSNNNATTANYRVCILYEVEKVSKQELAVAILRRGRGTTRRTP